MSLPRARALAAAQRAVAATAWARRGPSALVVRRPYPGALRAAVRPWATLATATAHLGLEAALATGATRIRDDSGGRRLSSATVTATPDIEATTTSHGRLYDVIRIRYASQGGTAQLFAMQLSDAIQEALGDGADAPRIDVEPWAAVAPEELLAAAPADGGDGPSVLYVLLCSTTGVGEPPDNGRALYQHLTTNPRPADQESRGPAYCLFGLGNRAAHPHHFNAVARAVDAALGERGVLPLALGDDGDCLDDDFERWMEQVLDHLRHGVRGSQEPGQGAVADDTAVEAAAEPLDTARQVPSMPAQAASVPVDEVAMISCPGAKAPCGTRRASSKYQPLQLQAPLTSYVRPNLMEVAPELYAEGCSQLLVQANKSLNADPAANGLHELRIALDPSMTYETGDHFKIFPRNPDFMVDALCQVLDVDPHAVIASASEERYPHPTNISVYETLSHCVDLGAIPSPAFCKKLLGRTDLDYKTEIAAPRKTALELALGLAPGRGSHLALEDWLYGLPPMQGRYYSIATSPLRHADELYLTYRPVKYVTTQGSLRRGTCTSYMSGLTGGTSKVVGAIQSNPTFRLPQDPTTPVILVAGGCGVAPIRAFLEERIAMAESSSDKDIFGAHQNHLLFLGFRNPADAVYLDLVERAKEVGAVSKSFITYTTGCSSGQCDQVTDAMRKYGQALVYRSLTEEQGHLYVCGGARSFGAAVQRELLETFQKIGDLDEEAATKYLRELVSNGRIHEDLSD